jgi:hypothetical protein
MATKNKNPYHRGNYMAMFAYLMTLKEVTRSMLIDFCVNELGMFTHTAVASTTVVLSPSETSERGDCRGNRSAQGHLYFMDKLKRKSFTVDGEPLKFHTVDGEQIAKHKVDGKWEIYEGKIVLEEQHYQLRFRKEALPELNNETAHMTYEQAFAFLQAKADAKAERQAELAQIEADKETARTEKATKRAEKAKADAEAKAAKDKAKADKAIQKAKDLVEAEAAKTKAKADKAVAKAAKDKLKADAQAQKVKDREIARTKRLADAEAAKKVKADAKAAKQALKAKEATEKADSLAAIAKAAAATAEAHAEKMAKVIPSETDEVAPAASETEDDAEGELAEA